jgi:hypothetical protein
MKLHAGHAVVAVMVIFILIMTQFMVRAYHNQETLVAEDYYGDELRYQDQIDKLKNVSTLGQDVKVDPQPGTLTFTFPEVLRGKAIAGELYLMRPSDAAADHRVAFTVDAEGRYVLDTRTMPTGAYTVQLEWNAEGTKYLTEDRIHLP